MTVWRTPEDVPDDLGGSVVTIGVLDGVHLGHQTLLRQAVARAGALGVPVVAVTFHPHPVAVLRPEAAPALLTSLRRRCDLLLAAGADHVLVLPFGRERSEQTADEFVDDVICSRLHARAVVVGPDFRFGHRAAGDVDLLVRRGRADGFETVVVDAVGDTGDTSDAGEANAGGSGRPTGERFSSSRVRSALAAGDVADAAWVLGRPFRVEGVVVHGDQRGRELGYPTANLPVAEDLLVPADGVYAGWLDVPDGEPAPGRLPAAISVGTNPTFDGAQRRVEAYALDHVDLDLYGVAVGVEFLARIRGQVRFDGVDDLLVQMADDVAQVRVVLADC